MTSEKPQLPKRFADHIQQFNEVANEMINSAYVKESKEKQLGITYSWEMNEKSGELDFRHSKVSHDEVTIKAFVLALRLIIQDNEPTSIRNMAKLYDDIPVAQHYKIAFHQLRKQFYDYLDEPATTLLNDKPTRRDVYNTLIYGKYAHKDPEEREKLEKWKVEQIDWDMMFNEFELTLHDFVHLVTFLKRLNDRVLTDHDVAK